MLEQVRNQFALIRSGAVEFASPNFAEMASQAEVFQNALRINLRLRGRDEQCVAAL